MKLHLEKLIVVICILATAQLRSPTLAALKETKLLPNDPVAGGWFGTDPSLDGDTLIVGALGAGSAYIFRKVGSVWTQEAKLVEGGGNAFGVSVSISGNTAVVGECLNDTLGQNTGTAYVFHRSGTGWSRTAQLFADATGNASLAEFGRSVAIDGDTIVVGSPRDDDRGAYSGSVYVFREVGGVWTQEAKLIGSDTAAGNEFGNTVAVDGDTLVVGAVLENANGFASGAVYVFRRSGATWTQEAKLLGNDTVALDTLGGDVTISGDTIVAGAAQKDTYLGAAYVFRFNGSSWQQEAKLTASDAAPVDVFGYAVAIDGDTAVVGALLDDDAGTDSGSAYVFNRTAGVWTQSSKLIASDGAAGDLFAQGISVRGGTIAVGSVREDNAAVNAGAVYVFEQQNHPPSAQCQDGVLVLEAASPSGTSTTLTAQVSDPDGDELTVEWRVNDAIVKTEQVPSGGPPTLANVSFTALFGLGGHEISVSVSDGAADPVSCQTSLQVVDTTAPIIVCPADIAIPCSADLLVPVSFAATATDLADPAPVVTYSQAPGSGFAVGTTVINAKATDASGNQSTCSFTVTRAALDFEGFLSPLGGADASGGSFADPLRTFRLGSTIPLKFKGSCGGSALLSGVHTLQTVKWSSATSSEEAIDATPSDAATTGHQFRLTPEQWQFNLDTKATGMTAGVWEIVATLSDGSQHRAWIQVR